MQPVEHLREAPGGMPDAAHSPPGNLALFRHRVLC
jgi:hypothetical protein